MNNAVPPREATAQLLASASCGDESAAEELIRQNMALVYSIAKRYAGRAELEDLIQIGSLGLLKAIRGYDPAYGTRLSTYAVPYIAGEIKRFLRDDGIIKVSRRMKENAARISAARERFEAEHAREPTVYELCGLLDIEPCEAAAAIDAAEAVCSIDEPLPGTDVTPAELICDGRDIESESIDRLFLKELLQGLSAIDRRLLDLRYRRMATQSRTATELGMTQVQVSRREKKILMKLHEKALEC